MAHSDQDYIATDPFFGDESDLACRRVVIRKARKQHGCLGLFLGDKHTIEPGQRYRHESALVDGSFWGEYRVCLPCMDKHMAGGGFDNDD